MSKHVKIIEGHKVQEWQSKYQKKIAKGKLKVFDNEKDLIDYAFYWKIDGKYYQVTNPFEWYAMSLRKSKGLTIALTCTSILATFFFTAAIIQSQVKWKADKYGLSVSLYADEGAFSNGTKTKVITGITKGTTLKDALAGYDCTPTLIDHQFKHWHVDDGKLTPTEFDEATPITENTSLKAYFELNPRAPDNFKTDSWETVLSVIDKGKAAFIDAYCKDQPSFATDKEQALLEFIDSPTNWRTLSVGSISDYGVRIIGVGQDKLFEEPKNGETKKELFTFEFNECVTALPYSYIQGGTPYYTKSGSSEPDAQPEDYCGLRTFTNDIIYPQLPQLIREHIKTVEKRTLQVKGGLKYHASTTQGFDSPYQFDRSCINGAENHLEFVHTPETLFSLSLDEIGATKIPFEYTVKKQGQDPQKREGTVLMKQTTHFGDVEDVVNIKDITGEAKGEGFYNKQTDDYTDPYMFYRDEWDESEKGQHTDPCKRMKRYFIGTGEKFINTQYRLRSIYIPNTYDEDDDSKQRASGNKDYRPFETWNVSENGDFGGYTVSGKMNTIDPDRSDERYHFFRGDMAWASIFVAPAFCL